MIETISIDILQSCLKIIDCVEVMNGRSSFGGALTQARHDPSSARKAKYDLQLVEPRVNYTASNFVNIADEQEGTLSGPFHGSSYYG